jgi:hypothetical protein
MVTEQQFMRGDGVLVAGITRRAEVVDHRAGEVKVRMAPNRQWNPVVGAMATTVVYSWVKPESLTLVQESNEGVQYE